VDHLIATAPLRMPPLHTQMLDYGMTKKHKKTVMTGYLEYPNFLQVIMKIIHEIIFSYKCGQVDDFYPRSLSFSNQRFK